MEEPSVKTIMLPQLFKNSLHRLITLMKETLKLKLWRISKRKKKNLDSMAGESQAYLSLPVSVKVLEGNHHQPEIRQPSKASSLEGTYKELRDKLP